MPDAVAEVLAVTDPIERQRQFSELLASLTAENAEAAVRALRDAPRGRWGWGQEYSLLTFAWGRLDAPAALEFASELDGRTKAWTIGTTLAGWASESPAEARQWVENIEDDGERSRATRGLISGLAQRDVDAATQYVYSLEEAGADNTDDYMETIVRQQMSQGREVAMQWADALPDGDLKGQAIDEVAEDYVRRDPVQAAEWVERYAASDYAREAVGEVADEWAERDPVAALEWVVGLPEGESRKRAMGEAVSEWADRSPLEAGNYVASMQAGAERDAATSAYARRVADEEPVAAVEWALSISSEELRNQTVARTVREWRERNPAEADAWVNEAGLPAEVVQQIQRSDDRRSRGRR